MSPSRGSFSAVPEELKGFPCWVNWRYVERQGKVTKIPIDPKTGSNASCGAPNTWGTFADAMARLRSDSVDGIGFQLIEPFSGIDLDKCRNRETGEIESWAQEIIDGLNTYSEFSPSGDGVHILAKGALPPRGRRKGHIEMYDGGRFFTMTGEHFDGTPTTVEERQAELEALHAQVFGTEQSSRGNSDGTSFSTKSVTDKELVDRARHAANGEKFARLWGGDHGDYASSSEADLALCAILAFWTGRDAGRMDRLFRQSGLFRPKWDERHSADGRTYGHLTIEKAIESTSEFWNPPTAPPNGGSGGNRDGRPIIVYSNRQLDDVTHEALDALRASNSPPRLFVRKRHLVRVGIDEDGSPVIELVGEAGLRARLAQVSDAVRLGRRGAADCFPSQDVVRNILALGGWPFPALQNIVEMPVLRPDGTVLTEPGYDARTRLVYVPASHLEVPEIAETPTKLDVADSLDLIFEVIEDFPFEDDASKANALAMLLTPIMRFAITGKTPLALVDAPQAGTGKGLLTEVVGLVTTGRAGGMMSAPDDEDEWRKRLTAALLTGSSIITIDNVERQLQSASLASVLTASEWTDRVLGRSEMVTLPVRVSWMATGNNIRLGGDIPRRCYWIRLDAKTARPWKRTQFRHEDLLAWVSEQRGEIVAALLTITRAWYAAGKPQIAPPVVGSFQEWARTIAAVLGFARIKGFLTNLETMYDRADESAVQWEQFLGVLASTFKQEPFTAKEVVERVQCNREFSAVLPDDVAPVGDKEGSIQRRLGKGFSKREGRRYGDLDIHLERAGMDGRAVKWRVVLG